jgi:mercuric ion transport protein
VINEKEYLIKTGVIGFFLSAVCCFTPLLVIILSSLGFATLVGYLDYVLLPSLMVFLSITVYAFAIKKEG